MEKTDLKAQLAEVAQRIRTMREITGLSEEEMAKCTGASKEEYQQCEQGERDFSFTFIYKCAQRFAVDPTDLIKGASPTLSSYTVSRKGDGLPITRRQGFKYLNKAPLFKNKTAEPFFVTMPYSEAEQKVAIKLSTHVGQEFDIVVKGSMKMQVGSHIEILHEGDTIYYNSATPHGMIATGGAECQIYALVLKGPEGFAPEQDRFQRLIDAKIARQNRETVSDAFVHTELDENGILKGIHFTDEEKFNFAFDVVDAIAQKSPDKLAMLHLSRDKTERRFTFGDISRWSNKTANYLESLGIKRGDRVLVVLKRHYQFWFVITALHKMGAVVIPATNLLMEHDFDYRFKAAGVKAILCTADGQVAEEADRAAQSCGVDIRIMVGENRLGWHDFDKEAEAFPDTYERRPQAPAGSDPMLMFFTSGTTGYPKIAEHSYKYALGHFITAKYWHNVNPDGLHFTISDTGWGKALWGKYYGQWMNEAAIFTYDFDKFDAHDILPMFAKYHITTFCAPPTMYRFFIKEDLSQYDLSSIEYSTTAGEALNPEVYEQWKRATGLSLMEGFGQTETTLSIYNPVGTVPKTGSMGVPSPLYDVDIVLPDGTPAPVGETGEIVIRTDKAVPCGLFMGYYGDEENTREAWHDNMYHTGDTAWRDEDGFYWYVGRTDDVIKSSGYRIGPFEIESVIMELPYVLECAVTSAPDPVRGQVVKAFVVLTKGTEGTEELKKEIQGYVKKHTAPYKYPRIVEFREDLPKTISGKIRRVELKG
ncbi:cupin domain-containing protein [Neglecta sp. X4]|uniref:AMP-binding protein n=1 Tax=unclassified Neglectibacter TaxID=2632164 RepID=UPI00136DEB88|nr:MULTISPECIES: AMP-binding protein [unclassified Neglectibacter]NBI17873.1 cupin domain-containing protein [Neglectibacter sp. 59]NBJ73300.1 cupin domain-containing protein [Neglectibacter sp. X4]NCE81162.1 cupin domain-containing protein [Neglectibacter sp. X58]